MAKYGLVRDAVIRRGLLPPEDIEEPEAVAIEDLLLVHTPEYVEAIVRGTLADEAVRRLGFPWSEELRERSRRTVQATVEAAQDAMECGVGINLAGGTHHAFAGRGEGFCVFNDVAVAVRVSRRAGRGARVAIIDLDVHQGNGTARIFAGDDTAYTFSIHGEKNYPFRKESSRLDIGLADGAGDQLYLDTLQAHLGVVLETARPDLVFYLAGADPYAGDRFGRLALSIEGLRARDRMVFAACAERGLPVVVTLAGGYARELADLATIHGNTVEECLAGTRVTRAAP